MTPNLAKPALNRYLPTKDLVFRKLFTSPANIRIIVGFIRDFFGLVVSPEQIRIINPYSIENYAKANHFPIDGHTPNIATQAEPGQLLATERDVTIAIIDTADVTIEMQLTKHTSFLERAIYYPAVQYVANYAAGHHTAGQSSKYQSLKPIWGLNILGFNLFADDVAFRDFSLRNNTTGELLPKDLIRVGFLELLKQPGSAPIAAWRTFFTTGQAPAGAPDYIQEAAKLVDYHNFTPQERHMIDLQEKAQAIAEAREQYVREEADAKARWSQKCEIARNSLAQGLSPEMVARITGLPLTEIQALTPLPA